MKQNNLKYIILIFFLFCTSCASLPKLNILNSFEKSINKCKYCAPFFNDNWQFVHLMEATMPTNNKAFFIGITKIFPKSGKIRSVITTLEGLVLFDGISENYGHVVIKRGVSHFSSKQFAKYLMNDIRLTYFKPEGKLTEFGITDDDSCIFRYKQIKGNTIDVKINTDCSWELKQYNSNDQLKRIVKANANWFSIKGVKRKIPKNIKLIATGFFGYSLKLELIEATPI